MLTSSSDDIENLAPLLFLEGHWRGEGRGPHGPYKLEAHVERRGRWVLMTNNIFDPRSEDVTYVSTQVYGHHENGLCMWFFDTAGSFEFVGQQVEGGLRFDWDDGENWKRAEYWPDDDGAVRFRYESVFR